MIKKISNILMSSILAISLTACGGAGQQASSSAKSDQSAASSASDGKTVKIGIIGARTGPSASLGQYFDGATAAISNINDKGGLNGYKFEVVMRDDEANPTKSKELIKDLLYKEKVSVVIGPTNTSNALAILPEMFKAKVPLIDAVATGSKIGEEAQKLAKGDKNYFFRTTTPDDAQADAIALYVQKKGFQKPVILHDETAYGKGGLKELQKALEKINVKPAKEIGFPMNSSDLSPQVLEAKESGADVILVWALGQDQAQIAKAKQKLGIDAPMIGSTSLQTPNFRKLAGDAANNNMTIWPINHVREKKQGDRVQRIKDAYEVYKKYNSNALNIDDAGTVMFAYDAAMIAMNAIAKGGNDPKAVRDAIESQKHEGTASKDFIQYSPDNHEVWLGKDLGMVIVENNKLYEMSE